MVVLSLAVSGCSAVFSSFFESRNSLENLRTDLTQDFRDTNFANAHWGVLIKSLQTGETIFAQNEKKMFMPASNMKLVSTSTALSTLSSDFRYHTVLVSDGTVRNDTLDGNIICVGTGDPSNTKRFNDSIATKVFQAWADSLAVKGITVVNGDCIGDDNCFGENDYGAGWAANYETDWYAAQISGICYNDNCIDITVAPDSVEGRSGQISLSPVTKYVTIVNRTTTLPQADSTSDLEFHRRRGTNIIVIEGNISIGHKPWIESVAVDNPTLYALTVMKEVFEKKGIQVLGKAVDIDDRDSASYATTMTLASYDSPLLSDIVAATNKPSQNLYAEQLFRTVGAQKAGKGTMEQSRSVAYPLLAQWGVDTTRLRMLDGSGLSRLDLITPSDIVAILTGMYHSPEWEPFYQSLPVAGVDGTIKRRMRGTLAEGNVHAKTGYIGYVRSLSGYVTSMDGEIFVFSMIANNYTVPTRFAEAIQNAVCVELANFSRK